MIAIYKMQLAAGRHFVHEHPEGATSWQDSWMVDLLNDKRVHRTVADQCMYGLVTWTADGTWMAAKKPTRFATSSSHMAARLGRRCDKSHSHQHLLGGRAAEAAFYPRRLTLEMLRGIRDTPDAAEQHDDVPIDAQHRSVALLHDVSPSAAFSLQQQDRSSEKKHRTSVLHMADGTKRICDLTRKFRPQHRDECTQELISK